MTSRGLGMLDKMAYLLALNLKPVGETVCLKNSAHVPANCDVAGESLSLCRR